MNLRTIVPCIAAAAGLAACSGGGPTTSPSTATLPQTTAAQTGKATGTLSFAASRTTGAATTRKPAYVSPATTQAALFIDGNFWNRVTCTQACVIDWVSTPGVHLFTVEIDDSFTILATGAGNYALASGPNGQLAPLSLNGTAATAYFPTGTLSANAYSDFFSIGDADHGAIVPPGLFDDGPVVFSASPAGIGTLNGSQISITTPSAAGYAFTAACLPGANGTFTIFGSNSTNGPGSLTALELSTLAAIPPQPVSYPGVTINVISTPYQCTNGVISLATSGQLPVQ